MINVDVNLKLNYSVFFSRNLFNFENLLFKKFLDNLNLNPSIKFCVFIDRGVLNSFPDLFENILIYFQKNNLPDVVEVPFVFDGGEAIKNSILFLEKGYDFLLEKTIDRHSIIIVLGGGAFLDAVGFLASTCHRGIKYIRIPTTVLSQNDAGIGVKCGVNFKGVKNFIGNFSTPIAIFNDSFFLQSLSRRDRIAGISEAMKVALIKDESFFLWLIENEGLLKSGEDAIFEKLIFECAKIHLDHIQNSGDPFEKGNSRPLDFGHWLAHKLESMSNFSIRHGEAVAVGIILDLMHSCVRYGLNFNVLLTTLKFFETIGFNLVIDHLFEKNIIGEYIVLEGLQEFREHLGGELSISIVPSLGSFKNISDIDLNDYKNYIEILRKNHKDLDEIINQCQRIRS